MSTCISPCRQRTPSSNKRGREREALWLGIMGTTDGRTAAKNSALTTERKKALINVNPALPFFLSRFQGGEQRQHRDVNLQERERGARLITISFFRSFDFHVSSFLRSLSAGYGKDGGRQAELAGRLNGEL